MFNEISRYYIKKKKKRIIAQSLFDITMGL